MGVDRKVQIVKFGNNYSRIHKSRAVKVGHEFPKIEKESTEDKSVEDNTADTAERSLVDENVTSMKGNKEDGNEKIKRKSSIRRPEKNRRVKFKREGSTLWQEGEVVKVRDLKDNNELKCNVKYDNGQIESVDTMSIVKNHSTT